MEMPPPSPRMYSMAKAKIKEKMLGKMDFLKNRIKKDNFKKSNKSNKWTLLIFNMTLSVGLTMLLLLQW